MRKKQVGLLTSLFLMLLLCLSFNTLAAYPKFSVSSSLKGYGWRVQEYKVYSSSQMTEQVDSVAYQECTVNSISGNAAKISYQGEKNETEEGWIGLKQLIYNTAYQHQPAYANASFMIYKRPSISQKYVTIPMYSGGLAVSERGDWVQVLFKTAGGYRLGWMTKYSFTTYVRVSMDTTTQPLANGTYTISPIARSGKALTYKPENEKFSIKVNKKSQTQKFRLQYVKNNYYLITPLQSECYLAEKNGLTTDSSNSYMWKLSRSGGYFYMAAKGTGNALTFSSGKAVTEGYKKAKNQKWVIRKIEEKPEKETSVVFSQYDPKWGGATYYAGPTLRTISTSGCGVVALTNAVYALNGEFISPTKIANFSASRGHYFYNQGTADTLYKDFAKVYGATYHFKHSGKTYSLSKVRKHLNKGGVAIALVPGHYIAIVGYRSSDQQYLVLDSAIYGKRPTTIYGDWVSASALGSGTLRCEYYHLLSRR